MARNSEYSKAIADKICSMVLDGQHIRYICSSVDMPHMATVFRWLNEYPEFAQNYAMAKQIHADNIFDEILDIADNCPLDKEAISKAKLMIDARKYVVSKLAPKKYGALLTSEEQEEPANEITINVIRVLPNVN